MFKGVRQRSPTAGAQERRLRIEITDAAQADEALVGRRHPLDADPLTQYQEARLRWTQAELPVSRIRPTPVLYGLSEPPAPIQPAIGSGVPGTWAPDARVRFRLT